MRDAIRRTSPWLLVALAAGCVGPVQYTGNRYEHRDHGYSVPAPGGAEGAWQRFEVEGATLAFRDPQADSMVVKSRCGRPVAGAQIMARHLLIGLPERDIVEARPVSIAGRSGWLQVIDTSNAGGRVRLKTVTLVAHACSFDLLLASSAARFARLEPAFDAWWQGFRFLADEGGA
jgi:hypothetical protein